MPRGEIKADDLNELVPEAVSMHTRSLHFAPDFIEMAFGPRTRKGSAAVCLQDAAGYLAEAHYGLQEAHLHWRWYSAQGNSHAELNGLFWSQFYADDAILRMYAAGESASAFLKIHLPHDALEQRRPRVKKRRREEGKSSELVRLGERVRPGLGSLSDRVVAASQSEAWLFITGYRDKFVHTQRPRIQGLGISFRRQSRWQRRGRTWVLEGGSGDPSDLTVETLLEETTTGYRGLRELIAECCNDFEEELRRSGRFK